MTDSEQLEVIRRLVCLSWADAGFEWQSLIFVPKGRSLLIAANCSDLFAWGCADAEEITIQNIADFERAVHDCEKALPWSSTSAPSLFSCRMRNMRPQGAMYQYLDKALHPLFDASGPEREVCELNPVGHTGQNTSEQTGKQTESAD